MPTYEYECPDCGHRFEEMQKITEDALTDCPKCQKTNVRRLVSATAFHLKGSGWYKTDYASNKGATPSTSSSGGSGSTSSSESTSSSDSKSDSSSKADSKKESSSSTSTSSSSSSSPD